MDTKCSHALYTVTTADERVACRGHATSGELGYGPGGKKSSAQPDKVPALEGASTHMVRFIVHPLRH